MNKDSDSTNNFLSVPEVSEVRKGGSMIGVAQCRKFADCKGGQRTVGEELKVGV